MNDKYHNRNLGIRGWQVSNTFSVMMTAYAALVRCLVQALLNAVAAIIFVSIFGLTLGLVVFVTAILWLVWCAHREWMTVREHRATIRVLLGDSRESMKELGWKDSDS